MGCIFSSSATKKGKKAHKKGKGKGKNKKNKKNKKSKSKKGSPDKKSAKSSKSHRKSNRRRQDDDDSIEDPLVLLDAKPDEIRKDIYKVFKSLSSRREKLKKEMRAFLAERRGIKQMLLDERERLVGLLDSKDRLEAERLTLMQYTWDRDCDDIFEANTTKGGTRRRNLTYVSFCILYM
jgi:hypothetical protein